MTLADRLRSGEVLHLPASVSHARRGRVRHAFRYRADYLLLAPETWRGPALLARDRLGLASFHDRDHGGPRGHGEGAGWAWRQLKEAGLARQPKMVMALLTQPRFLGHWFAPVSFWMLIEDDRLLAVIAEVNNTFGQRHAYLCRLPAFAPISAGETLRSDKVFHVSPYQEVAGEYRFGFSLHPDRLAIRILHRRGASGLDAAMTGRLRRLTSRGLVAAGLRRPGGSLRVLALIYWHALWLRLKGAPYRRLPAPPDEEIS